MTEPRAPSMVEVLSQVLDEHAAQMSVCMPGVVESFNRADQTAEVRVVTLRTGGEHRATVPNAPVVFPGAYWDVQQGEGGLLVIADEDWRTWWRTDEDSEPESVASHELSSAFFIPGLRSQPNARDLLADSSVLLRPIALGTVRLGTYNANKAALHENLLSDLSGFLGDLGLWVGQVDVACGGLASTVDLQNEIATIQAGIGAGSYSSPSVMVED